MVSHWFLSNHQRMRCSPLPLPGEIQRLLPLRYTYPQLSVRQLPSTAPVHHVYSICCYAESLLSADRFSGHLPPLRDFINLSMVPHSLLRDIPACKKACRLFMQETTGYPIAVPLLLTLSSQAIHARSLKPPQPPNNKLFVRSHSHGGHSVAKSNSAILFKP